MTTLSSKIKDVFNEPGCDKNQAKSDKERKKGCSKQLTAGRGGRRLRLRRREDRAAADHRRRASGARARSPVRAIPGTTAESKSSGPQLYRTSFTTDMNENDVVFGGEKRLYKSIKEIIDKYDPPAVFVYQTCVPAMIGDDINAVCKAASAEVRQAGDSGQCRRVSSARRIWATSSRAKRCSIMSSAPQEPEYTTPYDINIIGEYNLSGELWQVKPLLDELGIRILACISGDARYHEVASSHRARAAMMVCSKAMINIARKMEERYAIPFFEGSFYGIGDMSDSLRQIAKLLVERGAPAT